MEKIKPKRGANQQIDLFKPHEPIPRKYYVGTVIFSILFIFVVWSLVSYSGIVKPSFFLPTPTDVLGAAISMLQTGELQANAVSSVLRVVIGWALAALFAFPVGILMGSFGIIEALLEPIVDFVRYLPVSALIPLLILYIGIDEREKIAVIFIGTFFQLVLIVTDVVAHVPKELLDSAYTLGASRWRVLTTVLLPATLPGALDAFRITLGWAWTYLIVAELIAAQSGLGFMIQTSERGFRTDKIFVGLVVIGLLGFISDFVFKWLHPRLLPWSLRHR